MSLTVAGVQVSNFEKRGREYATKLFDGIRRHMPKGVEYRCACLTDDPATLPDGVEPIPVEPGLLGWWSKLNMFKYGMFAPGERILYFDMDSIIVGDLTDIAAYSGPFAVLNDPFKPKESGSAIMAWEAGTLDHIWDRWEDAGRPSFHPGGDQRWIEAMQPDADRWQTMLPGQLVSFKVDCWMQGGVPDGARVIVFHGIPRPHECPASYIKELWNRPSKKDMGW